MFFSCFVELLQAQTPLMLDVTAMGTYMTFNTSMVAKRLTNNLQVVCVADSGLYVGVVLSLGHTLQAALMV